MISLLPPNQHKELVAARTNTLLMRYVFLFIMLIVMLVVEMAVVYIFLNTTRAASEVTITENTQKTVAYSATITQAKTFRQNLTTAKNILDKQVPYTAIFKLLSDTMPAGTILERISIDPSTFGAPTALSIRAKTYNDAILFRTNINSTPVLANVNFQSISLQADDKSGYPYMSTFNVTFKKDVLSL